MAAELNVLALVKGQERYVYVFDDGGLDQVIDIFRDQAADPQLTLNWLDAAVLKVRARQQVDSANPERGLRPESSPGLLP